MSTTTLDVAEPQLPRLPWTVQDIERILPHREPFLFVDRIDTLEPDRRIVGARTWSAAEAQVLRADGGRAVPGAYLTECMAQVGALLVLSKPANRGRLIYFMKVDRVRFRAPVSAGQTLQVEAWPVALRGRRGTLDGVARSGGRVVAEGRMTFALGDRHGASA